MTSLKFSPKTALEGTPQLFKNGLSQKPFGLSIAGLMALG
jgi:hypothetical protein